MSHVRPDVVGRRLEDRFVVVNLQTNRIYELNATASVLWERLESGADPADIEGEMRERFDVEPAELRNEIEETMRTLTGAGLVT
jgi:hypothetical protein